MKKVIKHPKKMKNAMYIVFGVFALTLFAITRIHPSYANEGLMIDDALDAIVLYGEVEQLPEDEEVEEVQDEEVQENGQIQDVEEDENIVEPEETTGEEINKEDEASEDLDETVLERDNKGIDGLEVVGNEENLTDNSEKIEENVGEIQNPENNIGEENLGVSDNTLENKKEIIEKNEENGESLNFVDKKNEDMEIMSETSAILLPGQDFNKKIKSLAMGATVTSYYTADTLITGIQRATTIPSGVTTGLISTPYSDNEVIVWYKNGILYYYSQADIIYLNSDSSYMFSYMKGLTSLDLRNFDTSIVENMHGMFYYCENLTSLNLSNFDTSEVRNMGYMFDYIKKIRSLDVSNFDTRNVIDMGYMFGSCDLLETIYAGTGFITDQVVSSKSMYYSDNKLKGGNGTKYSSYNSDWEYAKLDTKMQSGYFTNPGEIIVNFKVFGESYVDQVVARGETVSIPINPEMQGYELEGWYTDENFTTGFDFSQGIEKYTEVYARMDGDEAILLPGKDFNLIIKKLANSYVTAYTAENNTIKAMVRTGNITNEIVNSSDTKLISTNYSKYPIYAWYRNEGGTGTIYYYTQAPKIYMNVDSSYMFYYMNELKKLDVSNFDTSRVTDMSFMFYGPYNNSGNHGVETLIGLETWDTSKVTTMYEMFAYNTNLTGIDISTFDMSSLENMNYMFYHCDNLRNVNASNIKNIITMNDAFDYCGNLETVIMDNCDMSNLYTWRTSVFYQNSKLETISMKGWKLPKKIEYFGDFIGYGNKVKTIDATDRDLSNVESMYMMFYGMGRLEKIIGIEDWDTSNVTDMYGAFRGTNLQGYLDLSRWNVSNVENMYEIFRDSTLSGISISGWKLDSIKNMKYMFQSSKLKEVNMSNIQINNAEEDTGTSYSYGIMYGMFQSCNNLEKVDMSNSYMGNGTKLDYLFQSVRSLKEVNFENTDFSNVKGMYEMFQSCGLTGINMSGRILDKVEDMRYMFEASNVKEVNMSNMVINPEGNTNLYGIFNGCHSLENVDMSNTDMRGVTDFAYLFQYLTALKSVNMSNVKVDNLTGMYGMFMSSPNVETVNFSGLDTSKVKNMGYIFQNAYKLKEIIGLEGFDTSSVESMIGMFYGLKAMTGLDLSNFDTRKVKDMRLMFYNAENLKTIYVGNNFNTDKVVGTGSENMFSGAISLVGGKGTIYDENHIDKEYARVDGVNSGYFTQGEFDIVYNLDGGELENKKTSYRIGESFTIGEPTRNEAVFMGWTGSNGDVLQKEVIIQKGTTGDLEYTANWKINQYKIIFDTNGGNEINPIEKDYNSLLSGITLPIPTRECNEFSGWDIELPEIMPAHDITLKAVWNYTCSKSSGGGGTKKTETITRETAVETPTENEHNSADEQKSDIPETSNTPANEETTSNQVISVTQEVSEDGTIEAVVETIKIKNTDIVATVRTEVASSTTSNSSSVNHTREENDAYSFAKSNGITTTSSIDDAKMNTELTRIQMAKMLSNFAINVLGQEPDPEKGIVKFDDVTNKMDKQYDNAVTKAYQLGIMGQNMKNNEFRPNDEVTRAEFASALSRLLYQTEEGEYKGTGKYYIPHVAKLYNEGIINKTDPKIKEKRGYVMLMLMRTVQ